MRNTLQEQYNLIKEGKGNKEHFFKSARHIFPDLITPVNSFSDAVTILKNRGVISENIGGLVTTGKKQDWHAIFNENMDKLKEDDNEDKLNQAVKYYLSNPNYLELKDVAAKYGVNIDDLQKYLSSNQNKAKSGDSTQAALQGIGLFESKEAKAIEKETTKEVTDMATRGYDYKDEKNYDNIFGQEFLQGYYTEMKDPKNADKHVDELRAIVAKNLAKDINHYVKDGQFGTKGVGYTTEAPGLGEPKEPKGKFKSSGYGDLKESVLRLAIQDIIKEVIDESKPVNEALDMGAIKNEGEDAKKKVMERRITNEIVKRKKQIKALETLTELEGNGDNDNAKKVKELQSEIKKLEGAKAKLNGKKKIKETPLSEATPEELKLKQTTIANSNEQIKKLTQQIALEKDPKAKAELQARLAVEKADLAKAQAIK